MKKLVISTISLVICMVLVLGSIIIVGVNSEKKPIEKTIYVEVVAKEKENSYMLKTDANYLLDALQNDGFIKTEKSELGVELLEIGGVKKKDSEHFELFVDGVREAKTIDKVPLRDKETYKFELAE